MLSTKHEDAAQDRDLCKTPPMVREMHKRGATIELNTQEKMKATSANNFKRLQSTDFSISMAKTMRDSSEPRLGEPFIQRL
jgi:hypothetical protein